MFGSVHTYKIVEPNASKKANYRTSSVASTFELDMRDRTSVKVYDQRTKNLVVDAIALYALENLHCIEHR